MDIALTLRENAVFRPGPEPFPAFVVTAVRIKDGYMQAHLEGGDMEGTVAATLRIGESLTHPRVGTFTLLNVSPYPADFQLQGPRSSADFRFTPLTDFPLAPNLVTAR